jgi:predicted DCC family thiol-disulfide oxidoreductase YuxK
MIPSDMARDATAPVGPLEDAAGQPWTVLYDSDCGFCRLALGLLLSLDRAGRLCPVALGTAEADRLLADLSPEWRADAWHLVAPDGRRWSAGAAAPPLLRLLPGGRLPATMLAAAPKTTERTYRWVANHRSTLSRLIPAGAKRLAEDRIAGAVRRTSSGSTGSP